MSKPWFSTNRDGRTVADDLNGYLDWLDETWKKPFELAISTACFSVTIFRGTPVTGPAAQISKYIP